MSDLPDLEITNLPSVDEVNKDTDFLMISKESTAFASGYGSFKVTPSQLMQSVSTASLTELNDVTITNPTDSQVLKYNATSGKWVNGQGGGGGSAYTDIATTLVAGQTTVTVNNVAITANSIIDIYTDPEIPFVSRSATVGQVTVTFDAQASDVSVIISIRSVS